MLFCYFYKFLSLTLAFIFIKVFFLFFLGVWSLFIRIKTRLHGVFQNNGLSLAKLVGVDGREPHKAGLPKLAAVPNVPTQKALDHLLSRTTTYRVIARRYLSKRGAGGWSLGRPVLAATEREREGGRDAKGGYREENVVSVRLLFPALSLRLPARPTISVPLPPLETLLTELPIAFCPPHQHHRPKTVCTSSVPSLHLECPEPTRYLESTLYPCVHQ